MLDLFSSLHQDGKTVVVVTHDPLVADRAQRHIRLVEGQIINEQSHSMQVI